MYKIIDTSEEKPHSDERFNESFDSMDSTCILLGKHGSFFFCILLFVGLENECIC